MTIPARHYAPATRRRVKSVLIGVNVRELFVYYRPEDGPDYLSRKHWLADGPTLPLLTWRGVRRARHGTTLTEISLAEGEST